MPPYVEIPLMYRKGTVRLLALTKDLSKEDKDELIQYISDLETRERYLVRKIEEFVNCMTSVRRD